jgi:putative membrane protein
MRIFTAVLVNAAALAVAAWLFAGIRVGGADNTDRLVTLLVVAIIFGLINAIVAPVIKLLALPFIVLTLGLLLLVINAGMLLLAAEVADAVDIAFRVRGFWTAVGGALVISLVSWALELALDRD